MHHDVGRALMKSHHSRTFMLAATIALMLSKENVFDSGFASLMTRTVPAVVNIASATTPSFENELIDIPPAVKKNGLWSLGSGVVFRPDGYIVTNCHVINRASDIRVGMSDDRVLEARIVGTDAKTDIAVLKVDATGLPYLKLSDSGSVRVGDMAFAIGDPFGLRQSVTLGIISGTGRTGLGILDYEDFIQTDAAINPGSSGGALINLQGQLVGIITAGKQYTGIGLAVPAHMISTVTQQILAHGRVMRGWLGVGSQSLTTSIATAFGLTGNLRGVLVADVSPDSPAERAGVAVGDIILTVNGKSLREPGELNLLIAEQGPGDKVRLEVYRSGEKLGFTVVLAEERSNAKTRSTGQVLTEPANVLGLSVKNTRKGRPQDNDSDSERSGVIITDVRPESIASAAQLVENDIIVEINRKRVQSVADFYSLVRSSRQQPMLLLIERSGARMFVILDPTATLSQDDPVSR